MTMESSLSKISSLVIVTSVASLIIWKTWRWMDRNTKSKSDWKTGYNERESNEQTDFGDPKKYIENKKVIIVNTAGEWDAAYEQLKRDLKIKKVLGMDCEWVHKSKVALLQLCTAEGFCVLVRLFKLQSPFPMTLCSLLADKSIVKTGVAIVDDGHKLHQDYGLFVSGCVDLRHMLLRMRIHSHSCGLKGLASKILHLDINKDLAVRCGNWEAEKYSQKQINYAATDAAVGVDIFVQLVLHKMIMSGKNPKSLSEDGKERDAPLMRNIDQKDSQSFSTSDQNSSSQEIKPGPSRDKAGDMRGHEDSGNPSLTDLAQDAVSDVSVSDENSERGSLVLSKVASGSGCDARGRLMDDVQQEDAQFWRMACSLCQGLLDVGYTYKTKGGQSSGSKKPGSKKDPMASYSTRQRPLWDNCRLQAPDGSVLCTCDVRKAQWYLDKELGDKVSDDPFTVRLRFEPSNRPQNERNYYLQEKENQCVVCGQSENYVRKFVIPFEYKKFFPSALKDHSSHDVLLLCVECHRRSCDFDSRLRLQLAEECDAPVESGATAKTLVDHDLQKVRSAGRALKFNRNSIPETRVKELEQIVLDYFGVGVLSDDVIEQAADIDARQTADGYVPHGKRVVRHMSKNGGLLAFQTRWRQHFLDTMNPRFLPAYWSVDYVPEGWSNLQLAN